ncbi:MAG: hypothetical protein KDE53_23250, partial [Caldilineaceae bacterium]|nr:hypothetical protein [Caldilineaceae bacterium]
SSIGGIIRRDTDATSDTNDALEAYSVIRQHKQVGLVTRLKAGYAEQAIVDTILTLIDEGISKLM